MDFNNFFENQIFSLHICLCTPKNKAFFEMRLLNANLKCTCTQNLRKCLTFSHCAMADKRGRGGLDPPILADIICEHPLNNVNVCTCCY